MWWSHKHAYRGPQNILSTLVLREKVCEYICRCGSKIKIFEDGEILGIWGRDNSLIFRSETKHDGKFVMGFATNFDIKKTKKIKDSDINYKILNY